MAIDTRKTGTVLLILGVTAWIPFLLLVVLGRQPSIYPFLAVHLTGVIGGSRLRSLATPEKQRRPRRQVWGRVLIILGVLAWLPWFYQTDLLGRDLQIAPYLALHLTGVLSGLALLLSAPLQRAWRQLRSSTKETVFLAKRESEEPGF
jgi:hypothetical protein